MKDLMSLMRAGQVVVGPFVVSASPSAVEIVGYSGADFVIIDCEHSALSPYGTELESCVRAAYAADVTPLVRVTSKDGGQLLKAANFGAKGVIVPHINTPEEMTRMVQYSKLPPVGNRSCAPPVRAARHGWEPWGDFVARTNEELLVIPLFEEPQGLESVEEILAVPGVDIAFFGPFDLGQRVAGVGTSGAEKKVQEYLEKLLAVCTRLGIPVMNLAWTANQARDQVKAGCRAIAYSTDVSLLNDALREQFAVLRDTLGTVVTEPLQASP